MGKLCDRKDNLMDCCCNQTDESMCSDPIQTSPLDLSMKRQFPYPQCPSTPSETCPKNSNCNIGSITSDDILEVPIVITQPKTEWHYRSLKDLQKKHLPYLAGIGPQRTPIRVTTPQTYIEPIYLGISVVTADDLPHESKVIVPGKTYVDADYLSHDNNLGCLRFDKCNPTDHFRPYDRTIYSKITSTEHQVAYKEVRIHMFNLYQNQYLTKELIIGKQLHQCKLAFWFATVRDGEVVAISRRSYSTIIEEKKMTTRSRVSVPLSYPVSMSDPRSQFLIDYDNYDNTDDDASF